MSNPKIFPKTFMVTIPVAVSVDAANAIDANRRARLELQKLLNKDESVYPIISQFLMGDSTIQELSTKEFLDTFMPVTTLAHTGGPTIDELSKLSSFDLCKKAESLSDSELEKLRDEAMQMGIAVESYETYKGSCRDPKYNPLTDKCFAANCDNGAEYEGGDARYYCGMCEKHAAIRYHYVGDLLSKVQDAKKAIPSVHMMKPHHSEGTNNA